MDAEPVALPADTKLDRALEEFFLRYRWPWFPVVDATGRFLGLVSRQKVEDVPEALRPGSSVDQVMTIENAGSYRIGVDEPLEALLASEGLLRLGALMAVDGEACCGGGDGRSDPSRSACSHRYSVRAPNCPQRFRRAGLVALLPTSNAPAGGSCRTPASTRLPTWSAGRVLRRHPPDERLRLTAHPGVCIQASVRTGLPACWLGRPSCLLAGPSFLPAGWAVLSAIESPPPRRVPGAVR